MSNVLKLAPKWLCGTCLAASMTKSATLCEQCARSFRLLVVPRDVPDWQVLERAASNHGVECEQLFAGLLIRVSNQRREIAKLHEAYNKLKEKVDGNSAQAV